MSVCDLKLLGEVCVAVTAPVIACGVTRQIDDLSDAASISHASAAGG